MSATPKNAKALHLFAIVRADHIQSGFTDIPALYETAQDARNDMMAPLESSIYPMVLLPAEDHAALHLKSARCEELEAVLRRVDNVMRGDRNYEHAVIGGDPASPDCETPAKIARALLTPSPDAGKNAH